MTVTTSAERQITIQLNNSAVSLIAAGDYDAAISALISALETCKQIIGEAYEHHQPVKTSVDQCMTQSPATQAKTSNEDEYDQYMYRQAIHIPLLTIESSYQASIILMIIFNLALAHQLSAVGGDKEKSKLRKAAKLYELSFSFILQRDENFENNVVFTMATVNNMGLIYHKLNDGETANKCFEHLLSTLMFLIGCGEGDVYELDGFLRNVSNLIYEPCSAAAA
jgi:tetratricopeptide (TPR) repeat protein